MAKLVFLVLLLTILTSQSHAQPTKEYLSVNPETVEVHVFSTLQQSFAWLKKQQWWGEFPVDQQLNVPRSLLLKINKRWQKESGKLPVQTKKSVFYRVLLPMVLHANEMIRVRRNKLEKLKQKLLSGAPPEESDQKWLEKLAFLLRIPVLDIEVQAADVIDHILYKLDEIPAGLVLGQAAYESGYGTSRFAHEGNALFGQWTFGEKGIKPLRQRPELGDHRIEAYEWPFDSVKAYFLNISSHPAYEPLRRLRAELKKAGKNPTSLDLADGLTSYSELGQKYVDTLKSIIRVNNLEIADKASFRDEPFNFIVGATTEEEARQLRHKVEALRASGELTEIIKRMKLE